MAQLNMKVLTDIMRAFNGQITANGLSSDLGISYSTFARANRSGTWPKTLADGSVLAVLDDYRERFFAGDGDALAHFVLVQLHTRNVEAPALEEALAQGGYGAFAAELIAQVHAANPEGAQLRLVPTLGQDNSSEPEKGSVNDASSEAVVERESEPVYESELPHTPEVHFERALKLAIVPPVVVVLLMGLLNASLASVYTWAASHRAAFLLISVCIAVFPAFVGIFVDSPLAWRTWIKAHSDASFSWDSFRRVAKYGAPSGIVPGAGRFNLTLPYLAYQPVCNLLSMMCLQALFALTLSLPRFPEFFCGHKWIEFLKVGIAISFFVSWEFLRDQCRKPLTGDPESEVCENPDNYLPSRVHMWANSFYLMWVITLIIVGLISLLAYNATHFRQASMPASLSWTYAQAMLFYSFSNFSPYAVKTQATGIGTFAPGVVAISMGFAGMSALCYEPSPAGMALCVACAANIAVALLWSRSAKSSELGGWVEKWRGAGIYPAVVTITIFGLLALGFATLAF